MGLGRLVAIVVLAAMSVAACGAEPVPSGTLGPCGEDAKSIGGYPVLEELLPTDLDGRAPDLVNSGRSCSDAALGTLAAHDVHELRFAGATWNEGTSDATVIAVLATPSNEPLLEEAWVEEFYTAGAVAGRKTDNVTASRAEHDRRVAAAVAVATVESPAASGAVPGAVGAAW